MNRKFKRSSSLVALSLLAAVMLAAILFGGCTQDWSGTQTANQAPIVQFVNIPPEGQRFSRNPEVFWVGYDNDGQIDYYRYFVRAVDSIAGDPMAYIASIGDSMWEYVDVDPKESDPQTANVIPLRADITNPVNNYVAQYIFLQGFDDLGMGSAIVYRILNRNDNPPETRLFFVDTAQPFVNSVFEGGIVTGVRMQWEGEDRKDYEEIGLVPPPFDFEWILFGPYTNQERAVINADYRKIVYVTEDARLFYIGDTLERCDTTLVDTTIGGNDTTVVSVSCDTVVFTANSPSDPFYSKDELLLVDSSYFTSRIVTRSSNGVDGWVQTMADTIYDVYRNGAPDTTAELNFYFWIRARDDAFVADLTPAFSRFKVINPKYERGVCVLDFTSGTGIPIGKYRAVDTAKAFWYNLVNEWKSTNPGLLDFDFDTLRDVNNSSTNNKSSQDYVFVGFYPNGIPFATMLKHKVLILYNDHFANAAFAQGTRIIHPEVLSAMDANINVWAAWRASVFGDANNVAVESRAVPIAYTLYFGVSNITYSSWWGHAFGLVPGLPIGSRVEDFIGTYALNAIEWPELEVDKTLLQTRLAWGASPFDYRDSIGALPEVNWSVRSFGTEVIYLYKSLYGADHPLGGTEYSFEGSPVAHTYATNLFKVVHCNFPPLVLKDSAMQLFANKVLDHLYNPNLGTSKSANLYPDAPVQISIDQARANYHQRLQEEALYRQSGTE